jgi:phosphatidylserine/phosphatidylglycerophosphate/cardiolipin synthase-like enzyme
LITISASAADITVGFSPDGGAEALIIGVIGSAKKQILVAAYSFTNKPIARALVDAKNRGVDVKAVLDKSQESEKYTAATFLANEGVPVRIDSRHAIMHNKYLVIDGKTIETGSFNYTSNATKHNAENAIVIRDEPALAMRYTQDWQTHWDHAQPYRARY